MPPSRVGISLSAFAFTATLATVAAVALFPTSAFALKSPPTGAPCQIDTWTFCPFGGLARRNLSGDDLGFANLYKANLSGANLSNANLRGANLFGASLSTANL